MRNFYFVLALILVACSPSSIEEFQFEGENIAKRLLKQLEKVHSVSDLKREGPKLKKEYAHLARLMIAAKKFQNSHPNEEEPGLEGLEVSEDLKKEFIRIYQLEGCLELMEELQRESLHKLDLYRLRLEARKTEIFR